MLVLNVSYYNEMDMKAFTHSLPLTMSLRAVVNHQRLEMMHGQFIAPLHLGMTALGQFHSLHCIFLSVM